MPTLSFMRVFALLFALFSFLGTAIAGSYDLKPGEKITAPDGRSVENTGRGTVKITYTGTKSGTGQNIEISGGTITQVDNPHVGGSKGVKINTGNPPVQGQGGLVINLATDGTAIADVKVDITGGNATITVNGDYNTFTVGGTNNTVTINGSHNTGSGTPGSGGTIHMGPSQQGSTFNSGGGTWTTI